MEIYRKNGKNRLKKWITGDFYIVLATFLCYVFFVLWAILWFNFLNKLNFDTMCCFQIFFLNFYQFRLVKWIFHNISPKISGTFCRLLRSEKRSDYLHTGLNLAVSVVWWMKNQREKKKTCFWNSLIKINDIFSVKMNYIWGFFNYKSIKLILCMKLTKTAGIGISEPTW